MKITETEQNAIQNLKTAISALPDSLYLSIDGDDIYWDGSWVTLYKKDPTKPGVAKEVARIKIHR